MQGVLASKETEGTASFCGCDEANAWSAQISGLECVSTGCSVLLDDFLAEVEVMSSSATSSDSECTAESSREGSSSGSVNTEAAAHLKVEGAFLTLFHHFRSKHRHFEVSLSHRVGEGDFSETLLLPTES